MVSLIGVDAPRIYEPPRESAFGLRMVPELRRFYDTLRLLDPDEAYEILWRLRTAEIETVEAPALELLAADMLSMLGLAPALAHRGDLTAVADGIARRIATRYLEAIFVSLYADQPLLRQELLDLGALDSRPSDHPAIFLLFHLGPSELTIASLAWERPLVLVAYLPGDHRERMGDRMPLLDLQVLTSQDQLPAMECVRSLRQGSSVGIYPDVYHGASLPASSVEFLGTRIRVSDGFARLSRAAQVPVVPCYVEEVQRGRFVLRLCESIDAPTSRSDVQRVVSQAFGVLEDLVLAHPDWWHGWTFFDRMQWGHHADVPATS